MGNMRYQRTAQRITSAVNCRPLKDWSGLTEATCCRSAMPEIVPGRYGCRNLQQNLSDYEPLRRNRRQRVEELTTGDGRPLPAHLKAQICRELDRLELTLQQLKAVEAERDALLAPKGEAAPAPVAALAGLRGI